MANGQADEKKSKMLTSANAIPNAVVPTSDEDMLSLSSQGAVASLSEETGIPQNELRKSLVNSTATASSDIPMTGSPAASLGSPMGFGAQYGQAFVGISGTTRDPSSARVDGAVALGLGLGDANDYVGATLSLTIDSINPADNGMGADGSANFTLTRNLTELSAVSVGVIHLAPWGTSAQEKTPSYYAAVSKMFVLAPDNAANPLPLTVSLGVGNGTFSKLHDQRIQKDSMGYFGAVALAFHPRASVILDYTGSILTTGISVVPVASVPATLSVGLYDVNNQYNNKVTAIASLGYAFTY